MDFGFLEHASECAALGRSRPLYLLEDLNLHFVVPTPEERLEGNLVVSGNKLRKHDFINAMNKKAADIEFILVDLSPLSISKKVLSNIKKSAQSNFVVNLEKKSPLFQKRFKSTKFQGVFKTTDNALRIFGDCVILVQYENDTEMWRMYCLRDNVKELDLRRKHLNSGLPNIVETFKNDFPEDPEIMINALTMLKKDNRDAISKIKGQDYVQDDEPLINLFSQLQLSQYVNSKEKSNPKIEANKSTKEKLSHTKVCWRCMKTREEVELFKCVGCFKGRYCSEDCQEKDWSKHREYCVKRQSQRKLLD